MSKKVDLNKVAEDLFKAYPEKIKLFITSDGQGFFTKNPAINHADKNKLEYKEFFRDGYQTEVDTDMEDALIKAEEKVRGYEATLEKVEDVVNVDLEEAIEVSGEVHEAVKAAFELRLKYAESESNLSEAKEAITGYPEMKKRAEDAESENSLLKEENTRLKASPNANADYQELLKGLAELLNGNTTKLAGEITKLLPVITED